MKKFTILAAFLLFATIGMFAQEADTTTVIIKNHEVKINDGDDEIKIKIYELKDGKRVSNDPIYESRYTRKRAEGIAKRFTYSMSKDEQLVREETKETVVTSKSRWFNNELKQPLPGLYFSHLQMTKGAFGPIADPDIMRQRPSSFEWGIYSPTTIFCTKGGHFGMATGLGISNSYNYFSHDYVLINNDNDPTFMLLSDYSAQDGNGPTNNYAHRSFLRYWSLRLPLTMQLQFTANHSPLTIAAGAELEWRFGMRSIARYGGAKHIISNNLNYNAIGCNALVMLGYDGIIVFGRMGLTEFFNSESFKDMYQLSIGIGFDFD